MFQSLTIAAESILLQEYSVTDADISWKTPDDSSHGDLSTVVALKVGRQLKKNPLDVASALVEGLKKLPEVERVEVAGPGYVNITLTPAALFAELSSTEQAIEPKNVRTDEAPVIIEYSQPNIAKPLAIHHIIGTVIGQALVNIYKHDGAKVISWNYIGDWGTQFGKLAVAYEKWGAGKPVKDSTLDDLLKLYVKFHEEVQNDESLEDQGREAFRKLEAGDTELRAFWADVIDVTKSSLAAIYRRLQVSFDLDLGESFYEDKMAPVLDEGKKKGVFVAGKEGSLIVEFPEEKNMPPYLVLKGDGATLYSTRDIAQMRYRIDTYHPQAILILTDIAQKLHFEQLVETCKMLEWELPLFENVLFGRMRFADKSMSTRKGNVLKLEEVLDEAVERADAIIKERGETIQTDNPADLAEMMGVGALVYGILSQNRKMDMVFDWDKMLSFEGNSAPYLQYTYARAKSVLRKAEAGEGVAMPKDIALTSGDRALVRTLLQFSRAFDEARSEHLPHKLANYLFELAQAYNLFYNTEQILKADEPSRSVRLALTQLTSRVLLAGASILTLRLPERM